MAHRPHAPTTESEASPASATVPTDSPSEAEVLSRWLGREIDHEVRPEQALALIGLGLMRRLAGSGQDLPWCWEEEVGQPDLQRLRRRLELTQLAIHTGAPLTTAEVTQLLGARPAASVVERGGLKARRLSRNVWKLSRSDDPSEPERNHTDRTAGSSFQESLRRRL